LLAVRVTVLQYNKYNDAADRASFPRCFVALLGSPGHKSLHGLCITPRRMLRSAGGSARIALELRHITEESDAW
jgi:hypothetical protein